MCAYHCGGITTSGVALLADRFIRLISILLRTIETCENSMVRRHSDYSYDNNYYEARSQVSLSKERQGQPKIKTRPKSRTHSEPFPDRVDHVSVFVTMLLTIFSIILCLSRIISRGNICIEFVCMWSGRWIVLLIKR